MKALLCAGFEKEFPIRLDTHIAHLEKMNFEIVVVIGGFNSEQVLCQSQLLERCELVFDTNDNELSLLSNIRAGMHTTEDSILVHPAGSDLINERSFQELVKAYYHAGLRTESHGFWTGDFPLLITRSGNQFFRKAADLTGLNDPRISLVKLDDTCLATGVNTL